MSVSVPDIYLVTEITVGEDRFGVDENGQYYATRRFVARINTGTLSSPSTLNNQVLGHPNIPQRGDAHPRGTGFVCTSVEANSHENDPYTYYVTANYGKTDAGTEDPNVDEEEAPWNQKPEIKVTGNDSMQEVVALCYGFLGASKPDAIYTSAGAYAGGYSFVRGNGSAPTVPVVNSANDFFRDPPTEPDDMSTLSITYAKKYADIAYSVFANLRNSINSGSETVVGVTIGQWTGLLKVDADLKYWNSKPYWQITVNIDITPETWVLPVADRGFRQIVSGKVSELQKMGEKIQEPWSLMGNGTAYPLDAPVSPSDVYYMLYLTKKQRSWSSLLLPSAV